MRCHKVCSAEKRLGIQVVGCSPGVLSCECVEGVISVVFKKRCKHGSGLGGQAHIPS